MTRVSKIPLQTRIHEGLIEELWYACSMLTPRTVEIFLSSLFSPSELIMIAKRLEILKQLCQKFQYADIKANLRVTEPTIAKMSMSLQRSTIEFHRLIQKLVDDEEYRRKKYLESRKPHWRGKMVHASPLSK